MKRISLLMFIALLAGGCSMLQRPQAEVEPVAAQPAPPAGLVDADGVPIERVPYVTGRSSATVERMAKERGCSGNAGAGRVTPEGPIEVYRMMCANGKAFMARCELRQCKAM